MKYMIHVLSALVIVLLLALLIHSRHETRQAREDYFKRGLYYGVKSLRMLIEKKEEDLSWDKLYTAAIMLEYDEKEKEPLYEPLKSPIGEFKKRGVGNTNEP